MKIHFTKSDFYEEADFPQHYVAFWFIKKSVFFNTGCPDFTLEELKRINSTLQSMFPSIKFIDHVGFNVRFNITDTAEEAQFLLLSADGIEI